MKKFLAACLAAVALSASAGDRDIAFYVGHKNGGLGATFQTVLSEELIKRGWNVDFKIIGNCGQVKDMMAKSDKPILAGWAGDWNGSAENVCNNPPQARSFAGTFVISPRLVCGPVEDTNFKIEAGRTYRIGVNQGQNHDVLLAELGKKLGVTFRVVEYQNSGYIKRAIQAREIDAWYTTSGLKDHDAGRQKCVFGTLEKSVSGITPLNTLLETDNVYSSFVGFLLTNDRFKPAVRQQLVKDIGEIIASPAYQDRLRSTGSFVTAGTVESQIRFVEANSRAFAKK